MDMKDFGNTLKGFAAHYKKLKDKKIDEMLERMNKRLEDETDMAVLCNVVVHIEATKIILQKELDRMEKVATPEGIKEMRKDTKSVFKRLDQLKKVAEGKAPDKIIFKELMQQMHESGLIEREAERMAGAARSQTAYEDVLVDMLRASMHTSQEVPEEKPRKADDEVASALDMIDRLNKIKADLQNTIDDTRTLIPDVGDLEDIFTRMLTMLDDFKKLLELKIKIIKNLQEGIKKEDIKEG
jgi:hypothetical protein